ncbi:MAG: mannitol dehydrogenase family protein, partial [Solirubrobacteraceae bacterium]
MSAPRLDRASWSAPLRPARIVHIGIGNFSRAHQAWYTMRADQQREWGIVAFTGRRPALAEALTPQQGLYVLIERGPREEHLSVIDTLQEVRAGGELDALVGAIASPQCAVVTLTVTEAGYRPPAAAERAAAGAGARLPTPAQRLALALRQRWRNGAGGLAVVSCDNVAANGQRLQALVLDEAERLGRDLAAWVGREVSFVSTSVDRITPPAGQADRVLVERELGLHDAWPVVCEPFSDWVLCGGFPAGRPSWEVAGARFVQRIGPWESRKLWLLNGAHSLLAYAGS